MDLCVIPSLFGILMDAILAENNLLWKNSAPALAELKNNPLKTPLQVK